MLYSSLDGLVLIFLHDFFSLLPYTFPFFVRWPVQAIGERDDPPPLLLWRNFQIIMLTRIEVALWVGILLIFGLRSGLNNPQSEGLERYYDENLRLSVVWVFHLGLQPCHFFQRRPPLWHHPSIKCSGGNCNVMYFFVYQIICYIFWLYLFWGIPIKMTPYFFSSSEELSAT